MKKKYILPCIVLVLSVISCVIMTVFTTDYMFGKSLTMLDYNVVVKNAKYIDIAHKVNPSFTTLVAAKNTYSVNLLFDAEGFTSLADKHYEGNEEINSSSFAIDKKYVTEKYIENMVKYSKEYYDRVYVEGKSIQTEKQIGFYKSGGLLSVVYPFGNHEKSIVTNDYAMSLYLAGKGEESKKVIEALIKDPESEEQTAHMFIFSYVNMVHRLELDEDFQRWMVEIEEQITQKYYEHSSDEDKIDNMFMRGDLYKPFDWQK